jgi:hypothetical protein
VQSTTLLDTATAILVFASIENSFFPGPIMFKSISAFVYVAVFVAAGLTVSVPQSAQGASCTSSLNTCAARCRKDNPQDRNCVSDHCTPKFDSCKASGCWQQGGKYGNVLTCNLERR